MITRSLQLTEKQERQIQIASAAYGLSGEEFILAAVDAAIATCAEQDKRLALVLSHINELTPA
jgi:hypothetical protein